MRPFADLTDSGQTRRLALVARAHLRDRHGLDVTRLRPLEATFNRMFHATTAGGDQLAVRVSSPHRIHARGVEALEHHWLTRLAADTTIVAPQVVPDRQGRVCHVCDDPTLDTPRTITVFTWLPGRRLPRPFVGSRSERAGQLLARLHEHAVGDDLKHVPHREFLATSPVTFRPRDAVDRLVGYEALIDEVRQRCQLTFDALWRQPPHAPHLLHGDFGPRNLLIDQQRLHPIDFQDLQVGFAVQDVAVTLADMRRWGAPADATARFHDGYQTIRPWPADDHDVLAALDAGRTLNLLNLAVVHQRPSTDPIVARRLDALQGWLDR